MVSEISTYLVSIEICGLLGVLFSASTGAHGPYERMSSAAMKRRRRGPYCRQSAWRRGGDTAQGKIAKARAGKPKPFFTFGQVTTISAPVAGTLSRLAMTSI